eukprot:7879747-Lingulodinium_polyedra.AAC.1
MDGYSQFFTRTPELQQAILIKLHGWVKPVLHLKLLNRSNKHSSKLHGWVWQFSTSPPELQHQLSLIEDPWEGARVATKVLIALPRPLDAAPHGGLSAILDQGGADGQAVA